MKIRMAVKDDVDSLIRLRFDYFATENWEITSEERNRMSSRLRQYYEAHLNRDFFAALAEEEGGEIVSTAFLVIVEKPANLSWPTGKTGLILNVLTKSDYRKKGYATKIMTSLIERAKQHEVSYIELSASEMGKPLYEKLGFRETEPSQFQAMRLSLL